MSPIHSIASALDQADLGAALVAQQVEELAQGLLVVAGGGPHQPAGVVVHDHQK